MGSGGLALSSCDVCGVRGSAGALVACSVLVWRLRCGGWLLLQRLPFGAVACFLVVCLCMCWWSLVWCLGGILLLCVMGSVCFLWLLVLFLLVI